MIYENENNSDFLDKAKAKIEAAREVRQEAGVGLIKSLFDKDVRNDIIEAKSEAVEVVKQEKAVEKAEKKQARQDRKIAKKQAKTNAEIPDIAKGDLLGAGTPSSSNNTMIIVAVVAVIIVGVVIFLFKKK